MTRKTGFALVLFSVLLSGCVAYAPGYYAPAEYVYPSVVEPVYYPQPIIVVPHYRHGGDRHHRVQPRLQGRDPTHHHRRDDGRRDRRPRR